MRNFRWKRVFVQATLLALLVCLIPASSSAAVFISVGFAPPVLPVYVQPPCPEPGWMWTPGYWAYGDDGYYWVPGTWVPAPYVGALWTPGYWGWGGGLYIWHPGYWGPHVGYYGGVNYGFGYMGIGFVGGMWAGGAFRYNTAVMRVNTTVIHNTYVDNTIVRNNTIVNDRHVAYSGGPGGINHQPTPEENRYSHEQHVAPTSYQTQAGIRSQVQCEQLCQPQWRASGECRDSEADDGRIAQQWRRDAEWCSWACGFDLDQSRQRSRLKPRLIPFERRESPRTGEPAGS